MPKRTNSVSRWAGASDGQSRTAGSRSVSGVKDSLMVASERSSWSNDVSPYHEHSCQQEHGPGPGRHRLGGRTVARGSEPDSVARLSACQLATEATKPVAMERVLEDLDEPEFLRPRIPRPCETTLLLLGGNRSGFRAGLGGETERDSDIVREPVAIHSSVSKTRFRVLTDLSRTDLFCEIRQASMAPSFESQVLYAGARASPQLSRENLEPRVTPDNRQQLAIDAYAATPG